MTILMIRMISQLVGWSYNEQDKRAARHLAAAAVSSCQQQGIIITGETISEVEYNAMLVFGGTGLTCIPLVGGVNTLFIELCASDNSELTRQVPYRSAALRITEKQDLTRSCTVKAIISIMKAAQDKGSKINVWASTPCTSGCP